MPRRSSTSGPLNNIVMLAIACTKATLVILFFMHVRWSSRLTWVVAASGFFWLLILFAVLGVAGVDAVDARVDDGTRRRRAAGEQSREFGERMEGQVGGHGGGAVQEIAAAA